MDTNLSELIGKAKKLESAEEIITLAKENGIELTADEAAAYYGNLHKSGELDDNELDNVSGGGCQKNINGVNYTVVSSGVRCFTGGFETAIDGYDQYSEQTVIRLVPGAEPRAGGWLILSGDNCCGQCRHLGLNNGLGYCKLSGGNG